MARAQKKGQRSPKEKVATPGRGLRESALLISGAITLYLWASLFTFSMSDPAWNYSASISEYQNSGGVIGAWFSDILFTILGVMAWMIPPVAGWLGWLLFVDRARLLRFEPHLLGIRVGGFLMTIFGGTGISFLHFHRFDGSLPAKTGGILGDWVGSLFAAIIGPFGSTLFLTALLLVGISIFTHLSWFTVMERIGGGVLEGLLRLRSLPDKWNEAQAGREAKEEREQEVEKERKKPRQRKKPKIEPKLGTIEISERALKETQGSLFDELTTSYGNYKGEEGAIKPPPLSLLNKPEPVEGGYSNEMLEMLSRQIELKLKEFGVEVEVVAVQPGPVITRFELMPAPGIKASKITNLSSDLARSLTLQSVRVVEVIHGKSTIGLEVPNELRETVFLAEILASQQYDQAKDRKSVV